MSRAVSSKSVNVPTHLCIHPNQCLVTPSISTELVLCPRPWTWGWERRDKPDIMPTLVLVICCCGTDPPQTGRFVTIIIMCFLTILPFGQGWKALSSGTWHHLGRPDIFPAEDGFIQQSLRITTGDKQPPANHQQVPDPRRGPLFYRGKGGVGGYKLKVHWSKLGA